MKNKKKQFSIDILEVGKQQRNHQKVFEYVVHIPRFKNA